MGYHERVYRFLVDEAMWMRSRAEMAEVQRVHAKLSERLKVDMDRLDWAAASKTLEEVIEGTRDAGFDTRGRSA